MPVLSVPGNIVSNNSNNMCMCMCMYRETKRETRNSGHESKSQSFRWSLRVNKQETREDIEGNDDIEIILDLPFGFPINNIISLNDDVNVS